MRWMVFALAGAAGAAGAGHTQDAATALARAEQTYVASHTMVARFQQTISNPMLGAPEQSRGSLYLERPARFAMHFEDPEGDRIIADGEWLWAYAPDAAPGQVFRQPIPRAGTMTPNLFAQFVERPTERYTAEWLRADTVDARRVDVVRLTPKIENLPFRRADLSIDDGGLLRVLTLIEVTGQRREFRFTDIQQNTSIPPERFVFDAPPGVRVITP